MKTPILGAAYVARSLNAAANRMINLFPEIVADGGKEPAYLTRCPGLVKVATVGTGPIRGLWRLNEFMYVVSGTRLYKVDGNYVSTLLGTVAGTTEPVSITDNGTQIFIACNPKSYIYNISTSVLQRISDPDFKGAVTVGYVDGYFVFNEPNSQKIWITSLLDGLTVDPLDFASAEGTPDNIVAIVVDHREVWVFGSDSTEVRYNSGDASFPLQPIQGAFNEIGCAATYSIAKADNCIFWLAQDSRGQGMVYKATGYTGQRVSTHAVEYAIQQYPDISDAIGYSYQQDGHTFYVLVFPSGNAAWAYDASTQLWHERMGWSNGRFARHRSNCHVHFNRETIVGDYENGNIYRLDLDVSADDGQPQRWVRSWRALPTGSDDLKRTLQHSLQVDMETGVGTESGQGQDPQVFLRWSDDSGHTWSGEYATSIGKIGDYGHRVIWRRLGITDKLRDRVYEISGTDPVKIAITGAELLLSATNG